MPAHLASIQALIVDIPVCPPHRPFPARNRPHFGPYGGQLSLSTISAFYDPHSGSSRPLQWTFSFVHQAGPPRSSNRPGQSLFQFVIPVRLFPDWSQYKSGLYFALRVPKRLENPLLTALDKNPVFKALCRPYFILSLALCRAAPCFPCKADPYLHLSFASL